MGENVKDLAGFKKEQLTLNQVTSDRLARMETMMEMAVRGLGMTPPPRRRRD